MSLTCEYVYLDARRLIENPPASIPTTYEILSRIRADQQVLFGGPITRASARFETTTTVTSTNAASGRTLDLSALSPPFQRVVSLTITSTGHRVRQVPSGDLYAMAAPRYVQRGTTLTEVASDWGSTGAIGMTLAYVQGPTDLDPTGLLTQTISIPDPWADLLVLPLARTLTKAPALMQAIDAQLAERTAAFTLWLDGYESDGQAPRASA